MLPSVTIGLALLGTPAQAQDFDARGMQPPPDGTDVRDPAFGFGGAHTGVPVVSANLESASDLLVQQTRQGPNVVDNALVDDLVGMNLQLQAGIYKQLGIGLSLPLWFFSDGTLGGGPTPGDLTVWVPIEIADGANGSFGVVPLLGLPTGADARFLGDPGPAIGALTSTHLEAGPLVGSLDAGADWTPQTGVPEWPGGLHYRYAAAAGIAPFDAFAAHVELRGRAPLASIAPSIPNELLATLKVRPWERGWLTASGGRAITRGVGASGFRLYVGVSVAPGAQPVESELVEAPPPKELQLTDSRGFPIAGAMVSAGGVEVASGIEGSAALPPRSVRDGVIRIEHPHYETVELQVDPELDFWETQLDRKPVPVAASVVGPNGALALTEVEIAGPYDAGPPEIDEAGVHNWRLGPGTWVVRMASPGLGSQERTIVIEPDRVEPIRVDAVLTPAISDDNVVRVQVIDRLGRPVEDAVVALDERDLGTTGTGGDVTVLGLEPGSGQLTIRSERFGDGATVELVVDETGDQTVQAVVDWRPGSVKVDAVDPYGKPIDASVTFVGPASLPARATGSDGSEVFVVRPGSWNVEVSAPGMGTQLRTVEVTGAAGEIQVVDVDFAAAEEGDSNVLLRIRDVDGNAVPNATITVDDTPIGATGTTGQVELVGLGEGKRTVQVVGPGIEPTEVEIDVFAANQAADVVVYWKDGVADVQATDPGGDPVDAIVQWTGPDQVSDTTLGADGTERLALTPGEWTVEVTADGFVPLQETVVVEEGTGRRADVAFRLVPEGQETDLVEFARDRPGSLEVLVTGPDNQPVDARITLRAPDGTAPISPEMSVGGSAELAPTAGSYKMLIEADGLRSQTVDVEVDEDGQAQIAVKLDPRAEGSGASVVLTAETERGDAVVNAEVSVDGEVVGYTDWVGTWELVDLPPEGAEVTITPESGTGQDALTIPIDVARRDQRSDAEVRATVVLPDQAQRLAVDVLDPFGNAVGADLVAVQGSEQGDRARSDLDGVLVLEPGTWTITALTDDGEVATAEVVIASADPRAAQNDDAVSQISMQVERVSSALADGAVVPVNPILFDTGRHELREDAQPLLVDLARWLVNQRQAALVEVGGHTDDVGGVVYNQQLSERRARTVLQALVDNGVAPERLVARGYGLSRPITSNLDDESRQSNRRVALLVLDWTD